MEKRMSHWSVVAITIMGFWIALSPLIGKYTGYDQFASWVGGEVVLLRVLVGVLFLYFAGIVKERNAMKGLLDNLRDMASTRRVPTAEESRQAVEILIQALGSEREDVRRTAAENLRRMTGQELGTDAGAWEAWWVSNREGFAPRSGASGES